MEPEVYIEIAYAEADSGGQPWHVVWQGVTGDDDDYLSREARAVLARVRDQFPDVWHCELDLVRDIRDAYGI